MPEKTMPEMERRRNAVAKLTLAAVLRTQASPDGSQMSRTLLDVIRENGHEDPNGKHTWKFLKDRLRRRAGSTWTSSVHVPTSDILAQGSSVATGRFSRLQSTRLQATPVAEGEATESGNSSPSSATAPAPNRRAQISRRTSSRFSRVAFDVNESTLTDSDDLREENVPVEVGSSREAVDPPPTEGGDGEQLSPAPARMSLLALLEETDRQMGVVGPTYRENEGDDEDEDEEEEEDYEGGDGGDDGGGDGERRRGEFSCCVCMVRHKGAAFIPCGHTFCRLCSRELWVSRGNCPICNGYILEILNIF